MSPPAPTVDWEDSGCISNGFCRQPGGGRRGRWTTQKFSTEYRRTGRLIRPVALASVFLLADFFMAQRADVERGREIIDRWRVLAEQRLEHLTELFETGRWRRYHSELSFLETIQEAKRAVQTWRAIATGGDVKAAAASVTSGFGWSPATLSRTAPREQAKNV